MQSISSVSERFTVWHVGGEDVRMRIPILKVLKNLGFKVAAAGSEDSRPFDNEGIEYHRYELDRGVSPLIDRRSLSQLEILFNKHNPDVVHSFDTKPALLVPLAARRAGIKANIRTVTGMGYIYSSKSPLALALRIAYRSMQKRASLYSDTTVFQNEDDKLYFEDTGLIEKKKSILVRGSGVDVDLLASRLPDFENKQRLSSNLGIAGHVVFIMIARMVKHKGVVEYLEAARRVTNKNPECKFLLVGPLAGEGRQAVSQRVVQSYADVVTWLGPRTDVPALLSVSDVFVLPSYYREGVPRVLLEAGALGLPLITTDMPGCRDVVRNGQEGLLVPPRNISALEQSMLKMAGSTIYRTELGACAKIRIEQLFTLSNVAKAYADIYRELMTR